MAANGVVPLWKIERAAIIDALRAFHGNRTKAAEALGISLRTLRNKIKIYEQDGVNVPAPDGTYIQDVNHESDRRN